MYIAPFYFEYDYLLYKVVRYLMTVIDGKKK